MQIALIASDMKKEVMSQFCIAYCGILAHNTICATAGTGKNVAESTGLSIECYLPGKQGGVQQITSRVLFEEIDLVIFFRDNNRFDDEHCRHQDELILACDSHNVPLATNLATAESLIRALGSGELDWRNFVNPISEYNLSHKTKFLTLKRK